MAKRALRKAIKVAGSQVALAKAIGKTQGHVSKWLIRNYIPPDVVLKIEAVTGVSRHDLNSKIYPRESP